MDVIISAFVAMIKIAFYLFGLTLIITGIVGLITIIAFLISIIKEGDFS